MNINHKKISHFIVNILKSISVPKGDRELLAASLVGSSLRGVDSHGIRLFSHYIKCLLEGRINHKPKMKLIKKSNSIAIYNADNGLGHIAAYKAAKIVSSMANKTGIAAIGIINSSHFGAAGAYSIKIAENSCIGLSFTHSDSFAIPFNGMSPFHGTNPYSFTAPMKNKKFLHVDFSSTSIPWNKVMRSRSNKVNLNKEVALDKYGKFTINPNKAVSLVPLGGKNYGHKGFGLASSIEMLCGPLIGMQHGYRLLSMIGPDFKTPRHLGHFLIAIKINSFVNKKKYFEGIEYYINDLKNQKAAKKNIKIFYPGEKELITEKIRKSKGIPFDKELASDFKKIAKKFNINF